MTTGPVRLTASEVDRHVEAAIAALRRMPYGEYLKTQHWLRQRSFALERAGQVCELCGNRDGLQVHHRTYDRLGFEHPSDLIVLCESCHADHHKALVLRAIRASERSPAKVSVEEAFRRIKVTA